MNCCVGVIYDLGQRIEQEIILCEEDTLTLSFNQKEVFLIKDALLSFIKDKNLTFMRFDTLELMGRIWAGLSGIP